MIITCKKFGQLGNQLNTLACQIASVREYNVKKGILYLNFSYLEMFPNLINIKEGKVLNKPYVSRIVDITMRIISFLTFGIPMFHYFNDNLDDSGKQVKRWLSNNYLDGYNVISSYPYYDYESLCKNHEYIKWCFKFDNRSALWARTRIDEIKTYCDHLIGIHIRRKDYRLWCGGAFYFNDSVYYNAAKKAIEVLGYTEANLGFIICSDEDINLNNFDERFMVSNGKNISEDLCLLSNCEYIIATQSSFSGWASFIGKVPSFRIRPDQKEPSSISDFMIQFFETNGAGKPRK